MTTLLGLHATCVQGPRRKHADHSRDRRGAIGPLPTSFEFAWMEGAGGFERQPVTRRGLPRYSIIPERADDQAPVRRSPTGPRPASRFTSDQASAVAAHSALSIANDGKVARSEVMPGRRHYVRLQQEADLLVGHHLSGILSNAPTPLTRETNGVTMKPRRILGSFSTPQRLGCWDGGRRSATDTGSLSASEAYYSRR